MAKRSGPSRWAVGRFGRATAVALAELIPAALQAAVGRQMDAQQVSRVKTLHAFGGAWPARYEELVAHLHDVPGVKVVQPYGRSFEVVLVNNVVLLPFEYAKDLTTHIDDRRVMDKLNKMALQLLEQYGPDASHHQPTLEGFPIDEVTEVDNGQPELLRGLTPEGVVIVFYAADHRLGLLRVGWGEVVIGAGRRPVWKRIEDLPLPASTPVPSTVAGRTVVQATPSDQRSARFDDAPLVAPSISARSAAEQLSSDPVTAEPAQETPLADDQG